VLFWMIIMKLLTLVPYSPARVANATVSGVIPQDMVWSGNIYVAGDVLVPPPFRIEIEPGTRVIFLVQDRESAGVVGRDDLTHENDTTATDFYERTHASLTGTIIASNVTFTSGAEEPGYADWSGLVLFNGSVLNDSVVEYSKRGVVLLGRNVSVVDTTSRYALWNCFEDRAGGVLRGSVAHHCWHSCVSVLANGTRLEELTAYECYQGLYLGGSLLNITGVLVSKSCTPLKTERGGAEKIVLSNRFLKAKPTAEGGVFEGRLIYPSCPESSGASEQA